MTIYEKACELAGECKDRILSIPALEYLVIGSGFSRVALYREVKAGNERAWIACKPDDAYIDSCVYHWMSLGHRSGAEFHTYTEVIAKNPASDANDKAMDALFESSDES